MALTSVKDSTRRQLAATRKKLKYDTICKKNNLIKARHLTGNLLQ